MDLSPRLRGYKRQEIKPTRVLRPSLNTSPAGNCGAGPGVPSGSPQPWPVWVEKAKAAAAGASPSQFTGGGQAISNCQVPATRHCAHVPRAHTGTGQNLGNRKGGAVITRLLGSQPEPESRTHDSCPRRERSGKTGGGEGRRRPWEDTKANRQPPTAKPPGTRLPEGRLGTRRVPSGPVVPLSRLLGAQVATPGTWPDLGRPAEGLSSGRAVPVRSGRQVGQRLVLGGWHAPRGGSKSARAPPGLATSRAARTPLGPARRGARGQRWRRLPWALTRYPEHTTRAAASSLPRVQPRRPQCRSVTGPGREPARRGSANPSCAAAGPAVPAGGARGCTRGVGARSLPLPAPRACSRCTCLAPDSAPPGTPWTRGPRRGRGPHVGGRWLRLYFHVSFSPYLLPQKESPTSWLLPAWPLLPPVTRS